MSPAPLSRRQKKLLADAGGASPGPAFLNSYKPWLVLVGVGLLLYFRTFSFGFTYLDDNVLLDRFDFISNIANLPDFFRRDVFNTQAGGAYYRPMISVVSMLDVLWAGKDPGLYHVTNVALHLSACCLLLLTLLKLNYGRGAAFFYALFFTVHPVLTQAVAWLPGRNDILLAVFSLLSFLSFLAFLEVRTWRRLAAHLGFLLLALLTKENAVFLCALCAFFLLFLSAPRPERRTSLYLWAGWLLVVPGWFLVRLSVLKTVTGDAAFDAAGSLAGNFPALAGYLGKIFFPVHLGILPVLKDMPLSYGLAAAALTGIMIYFSRTKRPRFVAFGISWFLLFLAPTFIQSSASTANFREDRIYLALIGFVFLLAELDIPGLLRLSGRRAAAAGAAVLLLFFCLTFSYSGNFRDKITFWKKAVASSPSYAFNYNNLGSMYYLDGNMPGAEEMWKKALELNPRERLAHGNLGLLYLNRGNFREAEANYFKEIELNPRYDNVYLNLGILYYGAGLPDRAASAWETAIKLNPDLAKAYTDLALLNYQRKNPGKARYYVERMRERGLYVQPELLRVIGK